MISSLLHLTNTDDAPISAKALRTTAFCSILAKECGRLPSGAGLYRRPSAATEPREERVSAFGHDP